MSWLKSKVVLCAIFTLIVSALTMSAYLRGPLDGHFDKYLMPAERWGFPAELQARGLEPLYRTDNDSGWDGQFYYFIANDLFAQKDTAEHIDADAYRYQRVGLPLFANILSKFALQDWVSPKMFYLANLLAILLGTMAGAWFFGSAGISPFWILGWSLGIGVQITLLNGLPDGAADGFLILAMVLARRSRHAFYAVAISFACLSREAYILFPLLFAGFQLLHDLQKKELGQRLRIHFFLLLPMGIFAAWQIFVRMRFTLTPAQQSAQVLGAPFKRAYELLAAGFRGNYPGIAAGFDSYVAAGGIVLFLALLVLAIRSAISVPVLHSFFRRDPFSSAVAIFMLVLCALYACFGDTVMWNFTGYAKAGSLFLFLIPFLAALGYRPPGITFAGFALILTLYFGAMGWNLRVAGSPIRYVLDQQCQHPKFRPLSSCKEHFLWNGSDLPGLVGGVDGTSRVAASVSSPSGYLSYGPYIDLPAGKYRVVVDYSATIQKAGSVDVVGKGAHDALVELARAELIAGRHLELVLSIDAAIPVRAVEIRTLFSAGELTLHSVSMQLLDYH